MQESKIPRISTLFDGSTDNTNSQLYHEAIKNVLDKILPSGIFEPTVNDAESLKGQLAKFHGLFPHLASTVAKEEFPSNMSFFALARFRPNVFRFFFEMVSHWLVPGKRLNVLLIYATDFRLPDYGSTIYTLCEVMIQVSNAEELKQIKQNLPMVEAEIRLGMESSYYARRILEIKGLSADDKTAMIQEYISYLIQRLPKFFDAELLTEMQHVLVICRDEFKATRNSRHLSRIIGIQYHFRQMLNEALIVAPSMRHLTLKLFQVRSQNHKALALNVGINFLKDNEVFEQRHLLNAIQTYIPNVKAVDNTFFANRRGNDKICTLYLEVEKEDGTSFTAKEIQTLRRELPRDLKDRIEYLMHPIFMPRNEEEVMRNIVSLSQQIKFVRDLSQVFISFDEQTHAHLFFTVIVVRIITPDSQPIADLFKKTDTFIKYIHDRCKTVGILRKKYAKEATVFRVKFAKDQFLRSDHSINLYEARQAVVLELHRVIGEFRDFNGGMISKQSQTLTAIKKVLKEHTKYNELLLENFFYSLSPVIMRTVVDPLAFSKLFNYFTNAMEKSSLEGENYEIKIVKESGTVLVLLKSCYRTLKEDVNRALSKLPLESSSELANAYLYKHDFHYLGYIYRSGSMPKQELFLETLHNSLSSWEKKRLPALAQSS